MNLKRNSTLNWLIMATWQATSLPKSLCTYFWTALFTIITSVLFAPVILIQRLVPAWNRLVNLNGNISNEIVPGIIPWAVTYLGIIATTAAGWGVLGKFYDYPFLHSFSNYLYSFGVGLLTFAGIGVAFFIVYLLITGGQWSVKTTAEAFEASVPGQFLKAKKSKICPPIDYTD